MQECPNISVLKELKSWEGDNICTAPEVISAWEETKTILTCINNLNNIWVILARSLALNAGVGMDLEVTLRRRLKGKRQSAKGG